MEDKQFSETMNDVRKEQCNYAPCIAPAWNNTWYLIKGAGHSHI